MKRNHLFTMSLLCAAALTATSAVSAGPEKHEMKRSNQSMDQMSMRNQRQSDPSKAQKMSRDGKNSQANQQQTTKLTGNIKELRQVKLADSNQDFVIARIDTGQGQSATALLGSNSQLSRLDLSKGDRVTVQGYRGHINDKSMLIANKVSAANRSVSIDVPSSRHLKRAQGEVMSKRTVNFRGFDEQFVVAEVELLNGKRETVNLGAQSKIEKLNLEKGDSVKLLVRPGSVGGESAMIAEQIQANGEKVNLPRPQDTEHFQRRQRSS